MKTTQYMTREEIRQAILTAVNSGESVDSYALHDRLCRTDAVGRISRTDSDHFYRVLAQMVSDGEVRRVGPFIRSGR